MTSTCNHAVAGVLVEYDGRFLLLQRLTFPIFKAGPAGHVDELTHIPDGRPGEEHMFRLAAARELEEECGVSVPWGALQLAVKGLSSDAPCARPPVDGGAHWTSWYAYRVRLPREPKLTPEPGKTADLRWYTPSEIRALPDLEPVWREIFKQAGVI